MDRLLHYLPPYLHEYGEIRAIMEAEEPELRLLVDERKKIERASFIETADGEGLGRFENVMGIVPAQGTPLEERRDRVRSRWNNDLPYTLEALRRKLASYCGADGFGLSVWLYLVTITTHFANLDRVNEVRRFARAMIPANMIVNIENKATREASGGVYMGTGVRRVIRRKWNKTWE